MQKKIDGAWAGDNIQRGPGIRRRGSGSAGFSLASATPQQRLTFIPKVQVPFGISIRVNPSDPSLFQGMVNPQSDILLSPGQGSDWLACSGLGAWFNLIANDVVTIFIPISSFVPASATVQSYGQGTTTFDPTLPAWDSSDNGFVFDDGGTPPNQAGMNIMIGYTTPDAHGKPYLIQCQTNHMLIENSNIAGRPALYEFSHRRRYGITAPP